MQQATYRPSQTEIQQLAQILSLPGYQVLQRVMMGEVDQFSVDLLNVDPTSEKYDSEVRAKHSIALSAGMFYARLQEKIAGYVNRLRESDQPSVLPDPTESLLD